MCHVANGTGRRGMVSAAGRVDPTPLPSPSDGTSRSASFRGVTYIPRLYNEECIMENVHWGIYKGESLLESLYLGMYNEECMTETV